VSQMAAPKAPALEPELQLTLVPAQRPAISVYDNFPPHYP